MQYSLLVPICASVAYAIYWAASSFVQHRRNKVVHSTELNCEEPWFPGADWPGITHLRQLQAADAKKMFPDLLEERFDDLTKELGRPIMTYKMYILGTTIYNTCDPKNIQALLATQFHDFEIGPMRRGIMSPTLGDGIFVQDGKKWEHSRAMLRPNFARDQISQTELEEHHVQNLLKVLPVQADGWTEHTNVQQLFFRFTIDSATEFLFGQSLDTQLAGISGTATGKGQDTRTNEVEFGAAFDRAQACMADKFRLGDAYWTYYSSELNRDTKTINKFMSYWVDRALERTSSEKPATNDDSKKEGYVFLEALAAQTRDPIELRSQLLNILLAGRDTTASLLSWLFHQFLRHPETYQTLRTAILNDFGTFTNPKPISFETLKRCTYLQHCLNETLRLWTVVPGNSRRTTRPTTLPRGGGPNGTSPVFLPAGVEVNYSIHATHRRSEFWGPDAKDFKPERWAGRKPGWEFLPFNGGPRICIGQQFALTEAAYVVVRLCQKFEALEAKAEEFEGEVQSNLTLTNCPWRPVTLRMREARE